MILLMAGWDIHLRSSGTQNSLRMPLFFRTAMVSVCHGRKVIWCAAENTFIMDTVCSCDWALGFIIITSGTPEKVEILQYLLLFEDEGVAALCPVFCMEEQGRRKDVAVQTYPG